MLTGEIRSQIDAVWNAFWSGGISNPLEVIEQITYLLFLRRLDDLQTLEENKATRLGKPVERHIFPKGKARFTSASALRAGSWRSSLRDSVRQPVNEDENVHEGGCRPPRIPFHVLCEERQFQEAIRPSSVGAV